jgi:hypothetical protein
MPNGSLLGGYNYPSKSVSISVPASVRYIRWYANGNQFNGSTHFCELQALTAGGTNRALDAGTNGRVSQYTGASPEQTMNNSVWQLATNGDTSSGSYFGFGKITMSLVWQWRRAPFPVQDGTALQHARRTDAVVLGSLASMHATHNAHSTACVHS